MISDRMLDQQPLKPPNTIDRYVHDYSPHAVVGHDEKFSVDGTHDCGGQ
jgi:hypothetical protein